jgi:hypothetical protein
MGRKKRKAVEYKPFCYYCEREFDDETILLSHQKARHFKCTTCGKRINNAPGMIQHCQQMHKEALKEVPNSLPGRSDPTLMIIGSAGIPEDIVTAHYGEKRRSQSFYLVRERSILCLPRVQTVPTALLTGLPCSWASQPMEEARMTTVMTAQPPLSPLLPPHPACRPRCPACPAPPECPCHCQGRCHPFLACQASLACPFRRRLLRVHHRDSPACLSLHGAACILLCPCSAF